MFFVPLILIRILFATCMVFIIGYVFGNFSKSVTLTTITKVASVLAIVLFISANIFMFRRNWNSRNWNNGNGRNYCGFHNADTTVQK